MRGKNGKKGSNMASNTGRGPKAFLRAVGRVLSKINGFCKKKVDQMQVPEAGCLL